MGSHYRRFPNITRVVRQVFFENPFLVKAYNLGVLNLTAAAELLHPEIERRAKIQVSVKTIAALLSRHAPSTRIKGAALFTNFVIRDVARSQYKYKTKGFPKKLSF